MTGPEGKGGNKESKNVMNVSWGENRIEIAIPKPYGRRLERKKGRAGKKKNMGHRFAKNRERGGR